MADVIYLGSRNKSNGAGSFLSKDLLPVAVLGALALGAYYLLTSGALSSLLGKSPGAGTTTTTKSTNPISAAVNSLGETFTQAINTAGQYVNAGVSTTIQGGYGIGSLFVNTGAGFPTNLFPLGDVNDTSSTLSTQEQEVVIQNECSEPYGGWWDAVPGLCG